MLPRLEDYFGLPYPFGKLDQIGVPDFEAGAMENAGAVTFREVALLADPTTAPLAVQKRVAEVITHELAHQWFGNLVTMEWWDDLWLNEAFATWMSYKIVDDWRPSWRIWMDFEAGKGAALALDALVSAHPIRADVNNAEEAGESFDAITYEKGGAVLRMIEGFLGEDRFRDGIRLYMRRHREANATADDLWGALGEASGQPILDLANGWIRQTGYPVVSLSLERDTRGALDLRQRRFFAEPGAAREPATRWLVPVVLRFRDAAGHQGAARAARRRDSADHPGRPRATWPGASATPGRAAFTAPPTTTARSAGFCRRWPSWRPAERRGPGLGPVGAGAGRRGADRGLPRSGRQPARRDRPRRARRDRRAAVADRASFPRRRRSGALHRLRRRAVQRARPPLGLVARRRRPKTTRPGCAGRSCCARWCCWRASPGAVAEAERRRRRRRRCGAPRATLDPNLLDIVVTAAARSADEARFDELRAARGPTPIRPPSAATCTRSPGSSRPR